MAEGIYELPLEFFGNLLVELTPLHHFVVLYS